MKKILPTVCFSIAALLFFGCGKKEAPKAAQRPPAPVVLKPAVKKDSHRFISSLGSTSSFESVNIVPQVTGQIVDVKFKQGDFVKKGQILAEIDRRPYQAKVKAAEASLAQAKAQLKIDSLEVERNRDLAKNNYVSKQTFDSYKAKVDVDEALVKSAEADLALAEINLDWCSVKSPVDGKAGFFNVNAGNIATANSTLITTVENLSKLYVNFFIPADRQFEVQELMKKSGSLDVEVSYRGADGKYSARTAKARIVENRSRYESSTLVLRAELDNSDSMFWPNQQVKTVLNTVFVKDAVFVPNAGVSVDNVGSFVFVAKKLDGALYSISKVPVKTVQLFPDGNYMVEGVKDGGLIVVGGQLRIANGAFAYAAIPQGAPIGADGKPIVNPADVKKFIGEISQKAAQYAAKSAAKSSEASAQKQEKPAGSQANKQ
ncbi:MAG: efflux RND transporter periplasmic adaptor subunit [Opitutales bacterium]|nr:efflux RND transporter periplasmic adaptor subunit [Opitutales bacterium]